MIPSVLTLNCYKLVPGLMTVHDFAVCNFRYTFRESLDRILPQKQSPPPPVFFDPFRIHNHILLTHPVTKTKDGPLLPRHAGITEHSLITTLLMTSLMTSYDIGDPPPSSTVLPGSSFFHLHHHHVVDPIYPYLSHAFASHSLMSPPASFLQNRWTVLQGTPAV